MLLRAMRGSTWVGQDAEGARGNPGYKSCGFGGMERVSRDKQA